MHWKRIWKETYQTGNSESVYEGTKISNDIKGGFSYLSFFFKERIKNTGIKEKIVNIHIAITDN